MSDKDVDVFQCECSGYRQTDRTQKCDGCELFYCVHCIYVKDGDISCFACLKHDPKPEITLDPRGGEIPPKGCGNNYYESWCQYKGEEGGMTLRVWVET